MIDKIEQDLRAKHKKVFLPFFKDENELDTFITKILDFEGDLTVRRILNTVQRFITLSDEITFVSKGYTDLGILFLVSCIEAIYKLSYLEELKMSKQEIVINFFNKYVTQKDKEFIENSIRLLYEPKLKLSRNITLSEFALLLVAVRNIVMHEGVYWNLAFRPDGSDHNMVNIISAKLIKDSKATEITYYVGLTYSDFRAICIRSFLVFIEEYSN